MPTPPHSGVPSLAQHLDVLYPLARVLAGPDEAERLVQRVYERAATIPPEDRPEDQRAWLSGLLLETQEGSPLSSRSTDTSSETSSFGGDSFRREVALQTAKRALPVAFAACSAHERFLLAFNTLGTPSDEELASALDTSVENAQSLRDQAHSALRAALRDVLTGPERMLVDVALPEDALQQPLEDLLAERFHPVPLALRSKVNRTFQQVRTEREETSETTSAPDQLLSRALDALPSLPSARRALIALFLVAVVAAGILGLFSLFRPAPEPPPNLINLSVNQASAVQPVLETSEPSEAEAYVQSTWDRRVSVPTIDRAQLAAVGRLSVDEPLDVPVFLFTDVDDSSRIAAFAYNYALLDRLGSRARFDQDLREQLARNANLLTPTSTDQGVVLWRHRDDIFIAVAPNMDPDTLRRRIRP